jgi:hypothetical protein
MISGTNICAISSYQIIEILLRCWTHQFQSNRNTVRLSSAGVCRVRLSQEAQCERAAAAVQYKQSDSRIPQTYQFNSQWDVLGFGHDRSAQGLPGNAPQRTVSIVSGCHLTVRSVDRQWNGKQRNVGWKRNMHTSKGKKTKTSWKWKK